MLSAIDKSTINADTSLDLLFDVLLKNDLNILIPPLVNNSIPEQLQQSCTGIMNYIFYLNRVIDIFFFTVAAFTTWFFGVMFYVTNLLLDDNTLLKKAIETQILMVRFLSRGNMEIHQKITNEYLDILHGKGEEP